MKLKKNRSILALEALEDRWVPSYMFTYNGASDLATLTQTTDDGATTVTLNAGLSYNDGSGTVTNVMSPGIEPGNLTVNMLSGTSSLTITLTDPLNGNLTLNLNNGTRSVVFNGGSNTIGNNLSINAASGNQTLSLANGTAMTVGGSANINLGTGDDSIDATSGLNVGSNLSLSGVNAFNPGVLNVNGNLTFNAASEFVNDTLTLPAGSMIGGSLSYMGNAGVDSVTLTGTAIGGSAYLSLSGGNNAVTLTGTSDQGSLSVTAGLGSDSFTSDATSDFERGMYLNLGSSGLTAATANVASIGGTMGSNASVTYYGGSGVDNVTYSGGGGPASVMAFLGAGNDTFTLASHASGTNVSSLYIDFGAGTDLFVNNYGTYIPNMRLLNLP